MTATTLLPMQPDAMTPAQRAAVSYLARYSGHTHALYADQLRRWFALVRDQRPRPAGRVQGAHIELYIRYLGESGLMASSVNTSMHAVRGFFRFATSTASSSRTQPSTHASQRSVVHDLVILSAVTGSGHPEAP